MKYLDEYRDEKVTRGLLDEIGRIVTREWKLMEVCGGQTHSILKERARSTSATTDRTHSRTPVARCA